MEICVDCVESAKNAIAGGATRLELCSALSEGGLTPTPGLTRIIKSISKIPIFAMIRVRGGDFVYTREEMDAMLHDLKVLKDLNIDGFVFGALTLERTIDIAYSKEILAAALPLPVTFHRAFDRVLDPFATLEILIDLGFQRVLTSGQKESAEIGLGLLRELVSQAADRIVIMPGAGITTKNIQKIKEGTQAKEFHASAKMRRQLSDGTACAPEGTNFMFVTDVHSVRSMVGSIFTST